MTFPPPLVVADSHKNDDVTTNGGSDNRYRRRSARHVQGTAPKVDEQAVGSKGPKSANVYHYAQTTENADEEDELMDGLTCAICYDLCVKPVTAPCQHNFCLKCFSDMNMRSNKHTCPSCRQVFGRKFAENPRINTALTVAIRAIRAGKSKASVAPGQVAQMLRNDDRPDEAFTTERAQRTGRANAASGRIMVTVPNDHFGPIPPEADPMRGTGVQVGEWWQDRLDCRQWGAHFPHVAGIAGQSSVGAQSVVLSGGYEDDKDEGDWFLYTGSGGRDLSGNKRTSKIQSFDQTFDNMNLALRLSCEKGLPVRVVRSHKEKRSSYAPGSDTPVRYDGIYRIAKCWRKKGNQGFLMCRYLFVRCDNAPAPWSSDESGDAEWTLKSLNDILPKKALREIKSAKGKVYSMSEKPYWDWDARSGQWGWAKAPPESIKLNGGSKKSSQKKRSSEAERALREMVCGLCKQVMLQPVTTPCDHSFCRPCLTNKFGEQGFEVDPKAKSGRSLRIRTTIMECPSRYCTYNIAHFLRTARVNRDMEALIDRLKKESIVIEQLDNDDSPESSSCSKKENNTRLANGTTIPEAWEVSMKAEKQREKELISQLYLEFKEFDGDLIQQLLEQEEDVRVVRTALQKMRDNEVKSKNAASIKRGRTTVSPRRSKRRRV